MNWREREADRQQRRTMTFTPAPAEAERIVEVLEEVFHFGRESRGRAMTRETQATIQRAAWKIHNLKKYGGKDGGSV